MVSVPGGGSWLRREFSCTDLLLHWSREVRKTDLLCYYHESDRLLPDGRGQAQSEKAFVENFGKKPVFVQSVRRECWNLGGDVCVPAQDEALVFCGGNALDTGGAGGFIGSAYMNYKKML